MPQKAMPRIVTHPEYQNYLNERIKRYERLSNISYDTLKNIDGVIVNRTNGAFYLSVAFEEGKLTDKQTLSIENDVVRQYVENLVSGPNVQPDKRFVYYLLGATGVCVVPLSSFATELQGFRATLLETDEKRFSYICDTIAEGIKNYLTS